MLALSTSIQWRCACLPSRRAGFDSPVEDYGREPPNWSGRWNPERFGASMMPRFARPKLRGLAQAINRSARPGMTDALPGGCLEDGNGHSFPLIESVNGSQAYLAMHRTLNPGNGVQIPGDSLPHAAACWIGMFQPSRRGNGNRPMRAQRRCLGCYANWQSDPAQTRRMWVQVPRGLLGAHARMRNRLPGLMTQAKGGEHKPGTRSSLPAPST